MIRNYKIHYTRRALLCAITLLTLTNYCTAQHVYSIRADTVRIYNTCDTAELVLENRTRDTLGFLFNKGKGRTEFRRLQLATPSPGLLSILGQDTVSLGITELGDTRYDLLSTNFITVTEGTSRLFNQWPAGKVVGYDAYNSPDMPPVSNQGYQGIGQKLYYNGLVVRDGNSGFDMAVNWNGELNGPNGAFLRVADDTKLAWSNWRELLFKDYGDTAYALARNLKTSGQAQVHWNNITNAPTVFPTNETLQTVMSRGNSTDRDISFGGTAAASPGLQWTYNTDSWRLFVESPQDSPAGNMIFESTDNDQEGWIFRTKGTTSTKEVLNIQPEGTFSFVGNNIWHAGNHVPGSAFTTSLTGANVLSSITTNASGHVTAVGSRALTLADISAAPATGSTAYIQNQTAAAQSAGFNITGNGTLGGGTLLLGNGTANLLSFNAVGSAVPSFTTRSAGSKIALWNSPVTASDAGWNIGIEPNHMWFNTNTNTNSVGFKWYGGTTQIARLDGLGQLELEGQGRFKGWYTANGSGVAAEIGVASGIPTMIGYNRSTNAYTTTQIVGGTNATSNAFKIDGAGYTFSGIPSFGVLGTDASGKLINVGSNLNLQTVTNAGSTTTTNITANSLSMGNVYTTTGYAGIKPANWATTTFMIMGNTGSAQHTYISAGTAGDVYIRQANNNSTNQIVVPATGAPYMGTTTTNLLLTSTNHAAGVTVTPTLSGANVLATLTTNAAGHITAATTRALTPANIGAAAATGATGYIQNQTAVEQPASFNIAGTASINGGRISMNDTSNVIDFGLNGIAPPTYGKLSSGVKISLNSAVSSGAAGYNIGVEDSHIWFGVTSHTDGVGFKWYSGNEAIARLSGSGTLTLTGSLVTFGIIQTSLRSMKKDIRPFGQSGLQILKKAQVRTFKYKADSTNQDNVGFIADEIPDEMAAVGRIGVNHTNTIAILVKAVQELDDENKRLQQQNADLNGKLDAILQRLANLEEQAKQIPIKTQ